MEGITSAVTNLLGIGTQVLNFITGNDLLMLLFSATFVGLGCSIVRRVKKTAIR